MKPTPARAPAALLAGTATRSRALQPEQAAHEGCPQDGRCTHDGVQRRGHTVHFKLRRGGPPPSSGEGACTATSDRAREGTVRAASVAQGRPAHRERALSGRSLGGSCGGARPHP